MAEGGDPPRPNEGEDIQNDMEEIRALLNDINVDANGGDEDEEMLEFDDMQLMCFTNHEIVLTPCDCHQWYIRDFCMSLHSCIESSVYPTALQLLGDDPGLCGCYFVTSNLGSMFALLNPVFMDRTIGSSNGVLIAVHENNRHVFLGALCSVAEMGTMPCEYMRLVMMVGERRVSMSCPRWMYYFVQLMSHFYYDTVDKLTGLN
ncbi:protein ORF22 [Goose adenovirus 4]|uniref:Protein ORF22 n=1 Tax=Goose adenovirus 4 TaxID=1193422 RepID=I3PMP3_9ADEN|nr:protein ORF22 [Goose adenovirus 4]AFC40584.1 protein ORF22 [Goose adenovirus 4]